MDVVGQIKRFDGVGRSPLITGWHDCAAFDQGANHFFDKEWIAIGTTQNQVANGFGQCFKAEQICHQLATIGG